MEITIRGTPRQIYASQDYGSEFDEDSEVEKRRSKRNDLAAPERAPKTKLPSKTQVTAEYSKDEGIRQRYHVLSLDAYARHKKYVNDYLLYYGGSKKDFGRDTSRDRTDVDVIRENHRFLWTDEDKANQTWEKNLAKKYWDKLFKEYCIADLSRYKENKIAMRWRIEKEVMSGKGQFVCGNKKCEVNRGLRSWEVNFGYVEHGEKKNALVKLRLCADCSYKLNYHHRRKEVQKKKRKSSELEETSSKKQKHSDSKKHKKHKKDKHKDKDKRNNEPEIEQSASTSTGSVTADKEHNDSAIWSAPVQVTEERTQEEEFEDYFEDMFL